tara:strand:- start:391 stop:804 length:414 start_codon:yes stop_codon:yes gene_type:complete
MAYRVLIDEAVNCVFVQHYDTYEAGEGNEQLDTLLEEPAYKVGMDILRDITQVSLPDAYDLDWFRSSSVVGKHAEGLGRGRRVAWVVGNAHDFKIIHQWCAVERLNVHLAARLPFIDINRAMKWLGIPEGYVISYPE